MAKIPDTYRFNHVPEFPPRRLEPDIDPDEEEVEELSPEEQRDEIVQEIMKRSGNAPS